MSLEMERMRDANDYVKKVDKRMREDFTSLARRVPSLLLSSGLILTVAYLQKRSGKSEKAESQAEKPEGIILDYLKKRLEKMGLIPSNVSDLLDHLLGRDPSEIALMLDEALYSAEALKMVAEARFGEVESG